jgi:hypothetical protein
VMVTARRQCLGFLTCGLMMHCGGGRGRLDRALGATASTTGISLVKGRIDFSICTAVKLFVRLMSHNSSS